MSEPASPLLTQAPKWLRQTSTSVCNARYVLKIVVLAFLCIFLGISVSSLYESKDINSLSATPGTGENAPYLQELRKKPYYHEIDMTKNKSFTKEISGQTSMLQRLRHRIQTLSPWGSLTDTLTCSTTPGTNSTDTTANGTINEFITTPFDPISPPILAKVTILFGKPSPVYERALRTHNAHNRLHDYSMLVLRQNMMSDVWSKPAYILSCILRELAKPPHERLQWLLWVDADTIIINPYVPIEVFLPPATQDWNDVHMLVTHDWNGLNNGIFPIRVCEWSVQLLSSIIAYPQYKPDDNLQFRDQSAMALVLEMPRFKRHTVRVPQRWFNAYQGEIEETIAPFQTRPGDLLVHFAGVGPREERMEWWLERAEQHLPEWEVDFQHTTVKADVQNFFSAELEKRKARKAEVVALREEWARRRGILGVWDGKLDDSEKNDALNSAIANVSKQMDDDSYSDDPKVLEDCLSQAGFKPAEETIAEELENVIRAAREKLSFAGNAVFGLDLSAWGAQGAEGALKQMEESMKRLRMMLYSRLLDEPQVTDFVKNLTESQEALQRAIAEATSIKEWQFPADEEKAKEAEKARLKEEMRLEMEAEALEEAEKFKANAILATSTLSTATTISSESTQTTTPSNYESDRGAREAANHVYTPDSVVAEAIDPIEKGDSLESDAFLPNKAAVRLEEDTLKPDSVEPTAEETEIPDQEKWWKEEGQYSESALAELRAEAAEEAAEKARLAVGQAVSHD